MTTNPDRSVVRIPWTSVIHLAAGAILVRAVVVASQPADFTFADHRSLVMAYIAALIVGEMARIRMPGGRIAAPLASSAALALAFTYEIDGEPTFAASPAHVILICTAGLLAGGILRRLWGLEVGLEQIAVRIIGLGVAAYIAHQWTPFGRRPLVEETQGTESPLVVVALALSLVAALAITIEVVLTGLLRSERLDVPVVPALRDETGEAVPLTSAVVVAGPFTAFLEPVVGLVAIPVSLFPVLLTYIAVRRYAGNRATYREMISTLSRITERGGYTAVGHSERVAAVSVRVGRQLGIPERLVPDLEFAALLHDVGQLALREPIPRGATVDAAPADQMRIAADGARIVRSTDVMERVAEIIEQQAVPYHDILEGNRDSPMQSRIIKVANAFDDLSAGDVSPGAGTAALERINLGLGYEYDPVVVEALVKVLATIPRAADAHTR